MSGEAFEGLMSSPLGRSYRLIAVDLPGHGASDDAADPEKTYTLGGYADAMLDVLFALDAGDALVCGWSLGGHVAYEMMARSQNVVGAFTIAAPPVTPGPSALNGFNVSETFSFFGREQLSAAEKNVLAEIIAGAPAPDFAHRALGRADGRARRIVVESILSGHGADPARLLASGDRPIALVCGEREFMTSWDFMRALAGPAIWRDGVIAIPNAAHAPFLEAPDAFNALLLQFIRDAARRRTPQASEPRTWRRLTA
jgi:pimeloyl-ACP methyl ester carboxylesterase